MPAFSLLAARAHFLVDRLRPLLPPVSLKVYTPGPVIHETDPLYLFAFVTEDYLIGGYQIPPPLVEVDLDLQVLHIARFLDRAWRDAVPAFCPTGLLARYTTHKKQGYPWRHIL